MCSFSEKLCEDRINLLIAKSVDLPKNHQVREQGIRPQSEVTYYESEQPVFKYPINKIIVHRIEQK